MKNFFEKYNAFKIETSKDEGKLTLETAKERILKLLADNIKNFKEDSWNLQNRMNMLINDTVIQSLRFVKAVKTLSAIHWIYCISGKK